MFKERLAYLFKTGITHITKHFIIHSPLLSNVDIRSRISNLCFLLFCTLPPLPYLAKPQRTVQHFTHFTISHEIGINNDNSVQPVRFHFMAIYLKAQSSGKQRVEMQGPTMSQTHTWY